MWFLYDICYIFSETTDTAWLTKMVCCIYLNQQPPSCNFTATYAFMMRYPLITGAVSAQLSHPSGHTPVPKKCPRHVFKTYKTLTQKTSITLSSGRLKPSHQDVYILGLMDVFWVYVWTSWKRCLEDVLVIWCVPTGIILKITWGSCCVRSWVNSLCNCLSKLIHKKRQSCASINGPLWRESSGDHWIPPQKASD